MLQPFCTRDSFIKLWSAWDLNGFYLEPRRRSIIPSTDYSDPGNGESVDEDVNMLAFFDLLTTVRGKFFLLHRMQLEKTPRSFTFEIEFYFKRNFGSIRLSRTNFFFLPLQVSQFLSKQKCRKNKTYRLYFQSGIDEEVPEDNGFHDLSENDASNDRMILAARLIRNAQVSFTLFYSVYLICVNNLKNDS